MFACVVESLERRWVTHDGCVESHDRLENQRGAGEVQRKNVFVLVKEFVESRAQIIDEQDRVTREASLVVFGTKFRVNIF